MRSLLLALLVSAPCAVASAQATTYRGAHPLDLEGHWHEVEGEHTHGELLVGEAPFVELEGVHLFLADPIAYGFDGAVWTFRGAHPLPGGLEAYCGISGEHRHGFAPEGSFRRTSSGAHVYIGGMRGGRPMLRPARTVPRRPVVRPPPVASPAPYWFWGCQYRLLPGQRGSLVPTALVPGCTPRSGALRGGVARPSRGAARSRPDPAPRSWRDGRYGGFRAPTRSVDPSPPRSTQPPP